MNTSKPSFADGLVELDTRETRGRLAAALAAVKGYPGYAAGPRSRLLQDAVGKVERALLMSAREAIHDLAEALAEADRAPAPATVQEAHAQIVAGLDADEPPPPPAPRARVIVPPPRPRLPART